MTDTPGWASPSSSEPPREDARPPADAPAAVPGQSAPPHGVVPPAQPGWAGPSQPPYGQPYGPQPGWGTPPSPKPGIIPLRPLGVGELMDGAVSTIREHWRTTLGLSLGIAVVQQGASTAAQLWLPGSTGRFTSTVAAAVSLPVTLLLSVIAGALLTMVVSRAILGRSATIADAWRDARPRLLQLLGLTLLTGLIGLGILLLGFAPLIGYALAGAEEPAITGLLFIVGLLSVPAAGWIWIQLSLAAPALMLEKQGVIASLSRSRRLVRNAWWRIFGINALSQLLAMMVAGVIGLPFMIVGMVLGFNELNGQEMNDGVAMPAATLICTAIGGVLASTVTIPFTASIGVLLYVDQRIRREALDIELARAAGLPEYGGTGWHGQGDPTTARL
ncbi:DUF7847 domain-containing protein [Kitasatospora sp. NPDC004240]